jgi:hypothetical protein
MQIKTGISIESRLQTKPRTWRGLFILSSLVIAGHWTGCDIFDNETPVEKGTIQGTVSYGLIDAATIQVVSMDGKVVAGPITASSEGKYSIQVPKSDLAGDLILESSGGEWMEGDSGKETLTAGKLKAYLAAGTLSTDSIVMLTPASTIMCRLRKEGGQGVTEADSIFKMAFGYAPDLLIKPVALSTSQASAPEPERLAGLRTAAFGKLTQNLGLKPEARFELLEILARDLQDGTLNGSDSSGILSLATGEKMPEDIQNRYEGSLLATLEENKEILGLAPDKIGSLPFAKVALTKDYRFEYEAGMMPAMQGRTQFRIQVSERASGKPMKGMSIKLMPTMYMANHMHSTPVGKMVDNEDGSYSYEVYYLMASSMGTKSMGYWELKMAIDSGSQSVAFYPKVMMGMSGDSVRATLKGIADKTAGMGMGMASSRTYHLFNDGFSGTSSDYKLLFFISTMENMMDFPAVFTKQSLTNAMGEAWDVDSMVVMASSDGKNWVEAEELGEGKWSASGLTGLSKDVAASIRIKVSINGEQKTLDGLPLADDESNGYATFSVTPRK